jgi:hypothetical protein
LIVYDSVFFFFFAAAQLSFCWHLPYEKKKDHELKLKKKESMQTKPKEEGVWNITTAFAGSFI